MYARHLLAEGGVREATHRLTLYTLLHYRSVGQIGCTFSITRRVFMVRIDAYRQVDGFELQGDHCANRFQQPLQAIVAETTVDRMDSFGRKEGYIGAGSWG